MPRLHNLPQYKAVRKTLRNGATPAEQALWQQLKGSGLAGRKFRRQHSVGPYILDFYCPTERLAVELDGAVHDDPAQQAHDADRDRALAALGIRVVRFSNRSVLETPGAVLDDIARHFVSPPPQRGGGRGVVR